LNDTDVHVIKRKAAEITCLVRILKSKNNKLTKIKNCNANEPW